MAGKSTKKPSKTKSVKKTTAQPAATVTPITNSGAPIAMVEEVHTTVIRLADQEIIEQVRIRAYELFEQRGRHEGYDREDWARAEAEILAKFQREKSA